jgi:GntR family transcriptional regulator
MKTDSEKKAPIARAPGTSLHRQLFMVLRDQILQGVYPPGAAIPREDDLCEQFGVSRITVRRAVADLESAGLLEKRPPRGTFVKDSLPPARLSPSMGLLDSLKKAAEETTVEVLQLETAHPPLAIASQLNLHQQDKAVHAVRVRSRRGTPVMITEAWVPEGIGDKVTRQELKKKALFEILLEQGVVFGRVIQEITAIAATPVHARVLKTEIGMPLVKMSRLIYDNRSHPVQHLVVLFSPERSRILMDMSASEVNKLTTGSIYHDLAG